MWVVVVVLLLWVVEGDEVDVDASETPSGKNKEQGQNPVKGAAAWKGYVISRATVTKKSARIKMTTLRGGGNLHTLQRSSIPTILG